MSGTLPTATPSAGVLHNPVSGLPCTKFSDAVFYFDKAAAQYRILAASPEHKVAPGIPHPGYWALNKFCEEAQRTLLDKEKELVVENNRLDDERSMQGIELTEQESSTVWKVKVHKERRAMEKIVIELKGRLEEKKSELGIE
jgi:hypothetical protein